ncbi:MAG: J domain-containing protein [Bryobacteraceae bacterium]|nr:J domain-containing protein [Bryobacteraceae bacterium]
MNTGTERRRKERRKPIVPQVIRLELDDQSGSARWLTGDLLDVSVGGVGVVVIKSIAPGTRAIIRGNFGQSRSEAVSPATVRWCEAVQSGKFHVGLEFESAESAKTEGTVSSTVATDEEIDHYETMQLSPNADTETIQRVYRMLAQRYHPDALQTGNPELFRRLGEAYRVLSSPELRARYDAQYRSDKRLQWQIFDRSNANVGPEVERRKRRGILDLLYFKALHDPERASMTVFDFEQFLGCPREHLEAALWYLKGKGFVKRGDNGKVTITVEGFDEVERQPTHQEEGSRPLLESGPAPGP